jgi:hypothetical protein
MRVAIAARNTVNLAALSGETGAQSFACDAVDPGQVARLFDDVESRLGMPGHRGRQRSLYGMISPQPGAPVAFKRLDARLLADVADAPDRVRAVVGYQQ